jgi:hypothetical protein
MLAYSWGRVVMLKAELCLKELSNPKSVKLVKDMAF